MKTKYTEKELLKKQQLGLITLHHQIKEDGISIKDFWDLLPGCIHTNLIDSLHMTSANQSVYHLFDIHPDELPVQGHQLMIKLLHPKTVKMINMKIHEFNKDPLGICTSFQYIKTVEDQEYHWFYSIKKKFNEQESISITNPVSSLGKSADVLNVMLGTEGNEEHLLRFQSLSNREKEILKFVSQGLNSRAISDTLCISIHTVRTHRKRIKQKLDVKSMIEMVRIADYFLIGTHS